MAFAGAARNFLICHTARGLTTLQWSFTTKTGNISLFPNGSLNETSIPNSETHFFPTHIGHFDHIRFRSTTRLGSSTREVTKRSEAPDVERHIGT